MTRVALFGGSFNPPHVAHQLVALYALETQPIDEVWFVPVFAHVFGKALAPFEDRVRMTELAIAPLGPRAKLSRVEEELARAAGPAFAGNRTLDLVDHLLATQRDIELRLLVGTDILGETHKWHRWDDVVAKAPLLVVGRPGAPLPAGSAATGVTMPAISSTEIRAALAAGDGAAASLLPGTVLRYIAQRGLYAAP
jgi:nicotinate-nucleotide adenylyltransferase